MKNIFSIGVSRKLQNRFRLRSQNERQSQQTGGSSAHTSRYYCSVFQMAPRTVSWGQDSFRDRETLTSFRDKSTLQALAKQLQEDRTLDVSRLSLDLRDGCLTLSGFLASQHTMTTVSELAVQYPRIQIVENNTVYSRNGRFGEHNSSQHYRYDPIAASPGTSNFRTRLTS